MTLDRPDPQDIIIFGAHGDLSRRKLLPALYNLAAAKLLPERGKIIGAARSGLTPQAFRELAHDAIEEHSRTGFDEDVWAGFEPRLSFVQLGNDGYASLRNDSQESQRLVYLAIPPTAVPDTIYKLQEAGLVEGTRLVIEKPFGHDLASAKELASVIHTSVDESQVFRIDHYLGKETVQNILVFRFGNPLFERVWNRDAIDHVQITVAESLGVEGRGSFYDQTGALRDIVQNHMLQMLSLLTIEPPATMSAEAIHNEKDKVFRAMRPLDPARTVRAQYSAGNSGGEPAPAYRQEDGIAADSQTETFFAAQVAIDSWRWAGVPFFLRTGKRLPRRATEVVTVFNQAPLLLFAEAGLAELRPNQLILRIQPDEGITLTFIAKQPGSEMRVQQVDMDFDYDESFMTEPAEAYERLLHDAMDGDQTLFAREDSVERAWSVVQPALDNPTPLRTYAAGSWGPAEAEELIAPRSWHMR